MAAHTGRIHGGIFYERMGFGHAEMQPTDNFYINRAAQVGLLLIIGLKLRLLYSGKKNMLQRTIALMIVSMLGAGPANASDALLVFGGTGNRTFLGCLNCSRYDHNSIQNEYGPHGSPYAANSIFNSYGIFGSRYSAHSPCNVYTTTPPVVVDARGNFYGYLTLNPHIRSRFDTGRVTAWLASVCQQ